MRRTCDAIGCSAFVPGGRFLCGRHWQMVPVATQRTINARYRASLDGFGFLSDVQYLQACVDAIESIAHTEGSHIVPSSYHRLLTAAKRKAAA